ncbi:MAG TPA: 3-carboxy-cis,cis-muconate cycloisomerase [Candidatus Sulfotelmatobacter sp.]|nr:3-carboxy-cis,cis-muconate cycloisomerase [Candidatus Sulfotelmatobacter sp.]
MTGSLLIPLFGSRAVADLFSDHARLQALLDFEAALAAAEAATGVIPQAAAGAITAACRVDRLDLAGFADEAERAGNLAIPLVKRLTAAVARDDAGAARFVHWGATSQDAIDTGLVLQLRAAQGVIEADLARLSDGLARLAQTHRRTPEVGRTWLQHALPISFGLKAAGWLDAVERHRARLAALRPRLLVLQFGGAAGTLASLGTHGLAVAEALAHRLDLALPAMPWHTARDRFVELGAMLGLIVGTLGKIARDLSLLMQTDVGEAFEPAGAGRGGSSTMPHKRNPVAAAAVLAAATRAPGLVATLMSAQVQEHERGLGGWHAEWVALPELTVLTAGALAQTADTIAGLEIDAARMRANLDATRGLIMAEAVMMALGGALGRLEAHHLIEAACRRAVAEGRHLRDVLAQDPAVAAHLDATALDRLFDPLNYLGATEALIDRVLAARHG